MNPFAGNPLRTRSDVQRAVLDLVAPVVTAMERDGPRVGLGPTGPHFDRAAGLHSIPRRFGVSGALWISGLLHVGMLALLAALPAAYAPGLGALYWTGVAGCLALLAYQHWIVRPEDLSRLDAAFFQANGMLSIWLFTATAGDLLLRG